jgi:nucleoside-diphosphate-sugar epimerase
MAFSKFIVAALRREPVEVYGDGTQTRDFTFVSDAVEANLLAYRYDGPMHIFNIGGGSRVSVLDVLGSIERETGVSLDVRLGDRARGDVTDTWADTSKARTELGFEPVVTLARGLRREIEWYREHLRVA